MKCSAGAAFALGILAASAACSILLLRISPPTGIAAPTRVFWEELELVVAVFLALVILSHPIADVFTNRSPSLSRFLDREVRLPLAARLACFIGLVLAFFLYSFWSLADLLGGYNGYQYSISTHPFLRLIYNTIGLRAFESWRVGDQAFLFFLIAASCFFALRINRGLGVALKDSITLFAAPVLIVFELGLWYFAPGDMTWHVTTFLWIGGANDLGVRSTLDAGTYLVSNWFVLLVSFLLLATRIPVIGMPSRMIWRTKSRMTRKHVDQPYQEEH